ncbi:MotA/TolQ/ExbB proton channel family protein [Pseudemcibacter aquimaris]|uniref:MotA/TolQ/ExbB proton channel family protein n=1 Tax=Pseudemcibacter aquimaris TaxID=2857064 RepID=UPI0020132B7D|nr:MotA/TolQ/ExbB proton channel family protein [Pseudemcibacter aquimaris]MCC3861497.1 MotA/TolQ/ExbB proton channel family protein [Pseudemcibacter aquimaris]WDU58266.1 MotA/TolQ/ExbB proton channel family protein [Pseudemcibacter aquimaris]
MNKIKILAILILSFLAFFQSNVIAQELTEVQTSAQRDLLAAIDRLNQLRDQIAEERIPLSRRISSRENSILSLRSEAAKIQAANDANTLALEDIRNDLQEWEEENNFLTSLLDEYARRFEGSLNVTERENYKNDLAAFNALDPNQTGENRISVQLELIDKGFARMRRALGGDQYQSEVITEDGILSPGQVTRFGPLAYYQNTSSDISGMVISGEGEIPHLFTDTSGLGEISNINSEGQTILPIDVTNGKAISIEDSDDSLFEHIGKGGIWIIPILLFAGLSTIASIIKLKQIYRIKMPERGSLHDVLSSLVNGDKNAAATAADQIPYPIGDMIKQGVNHADENKELVEEIMYESMLDTQPRLEKYLSLIAISAATAPLLGLLGTVTGMINTFELITLFGTGDAQSLSSGISEALITTEFGLIVAIPALIMHAMLSRKVQAIMTDMEKFAVIFVNGLPNKRR